MANAPKTPATTPTKKRRAAVDPNETKEGKFKRLGSVRVGDALKKVRSIANLSGGGYAYSKAQAAQIINDLEKAVSYVKKSFENGGPGKQGASYSL